MIPTHSLKRYSQRFVSNLYYGQRTITSPIHSHMERTFLFMNWNGESKNKESMFKDYFKFQSKEQLEEMKFSPNTVFNLAKAVHNSKDPNSGPNPTKLGPFQVMLDSFVLFLQREDYESAEEIHKHFNKYVVDHTRVENEYHIMQLLINIGNTTDLYPSPLDIQELIDLTSFVSSRSNPQNARLLAYAFDSLSRFYEMISEEHDHNKEFDDMMNVLSEEERQKVKFDTRTQWDEAIRYANQASNTAEMFLGYEDTLTIDLSMRTAQLLLNKSLKNSYGLLYSEKSMTALDAIPVQNTITSIGLTRITTLMIYMARVYEQRHHYNAQISLLNRLIRMIRAREAFCEDELEYEICMLRAKIAMVVARAMNDESIRASFMIGDVAPLIDTYHKKWIAMDPEHATFEIGLFKYFHGILSLSSTSPMEIDPVEVLNEAHSLFEKANQPQWMNEAKTKLDMIQQQAQQ